MTVKRRKYNTGSIYKPFNSDYSPTTENQKSHDDLVKQRALQGYNTSGSTILGETPEMEKKRKDLAKKMYYDAQAKKFAERRNEVPQMGMPAATNIGLKNTHPEFALMTAGVGLLPKTTSTIGNIANASLYGASQGLLVNTSGIGSEQTKEGLTTDIIGGGLVGVSGKFVSSIVNKIGNKIGNKNINAGRKWMEDWLNNPTTKEKEKLYTSYDNNLLTEDKARLITNQQIEWNKLKELAYIQNNKPFSDKFKLDLDMSYEDRLTKNINYYNKLKIEKPFRNIEDIPNTVWQTSETPYTIKLYNKNIMNPFIGGYSMPDGKTVLNPLYKFSNDTKSVTIHELGHSYGKNTVPNNALPMFKKAFGDKDGFLYSKYLKEPTEIYARIFELRNIMKLKPEDIVTDKQINSIITRGLLGTTSVDPLFFTLIKDKSAFKELFNKLPAITGIGIGSKLMNESKDKLKYSLGGNKFDIKNKILQRLVGNKTNSYRHMAKYGGIFNKRPQKFLGAILPVAQLGLGIYNSIQSGIDRQKAIDEQNIATDKLNKVNLNNQLFSDNIDYRNFITNSNNSNSFYADGGNRKSITQMSLLEYLDSKKEKTPKIINIQDNRKIRATTQQPINFNRDLKSGDYSFKNIHKVIKAAKDFNYNPSTALAVALNETNLGKTTYNNIGHVLDGRFDRRFIDSRKEEINENNIHTFSDNELASARDYNDAEVMVLALKDKEEYANKLKSLKKKFTNKGFSDEMFYLQAYNGLGNLYPNTESEYHSMTGRGAIQKRFYGVPINEKIDMRENPLYAKEILDLRDNIILKNEDILNMIDTIGEPQYKKFIMDNKNKTKRYAMGGVKPIASNLSVAFGARHEEQNGYDGTGVPYKDIEVEGGGLKDNMPGEVIKHEQGNDFIFSDRIPFDDKYTFAQVAQKLTQTKANLEGMISLAAKEINRDLIDVTNSNSKIQMNTKNRLIEAKKYKLNAIKSEIEKVNLDIEKLKEQQLTVGKELGLYNEDGQPITENINDVQFAYGGKRKKYPLGAFLKSKEGFGIIGLANAGLNLISNISAYNDMKKVKTPTFTPIKTQYTPTVNLSADRSAVDDYYKSYSRFAESNFANPQTAAILKNRAGLDAIKNYSNINQREQQLNTNIYNTNIGRQLQVDSSNAQMKYATDMTKFQKDTMDINNRQNIMTGFTSDINNVYSNYQKQDMEERMMKLQEQTMSLGNVAKNRIIQLGGDSNIYYNLDEEGKYNYLRKLGMKDVDIDAYFLKGSLFNPLNKPTTPIINNTPPVNSTPSITVNPITTSNYISYGQDTNYRTNLPPMQKLGGYRRRFATGGINFDTGVNYESLDKALDIKSYRNNIIDTPSFKNLTSVDKLYTNNKPDRYIINSSVQKYLTTINPIKSNGKLETVHPKLDAFQELLSKHGIKTKRTSGFRPQSKTSSGRMSKHSVGAAIDIVPDGITFDDMYSIIYNTPEIIEYAKLNNIGILDENDERVLKKTKGTGRHSHISLNENIAMDFWNPTYRNNGIYTEEFYKKYNL